MGIDYRHMCRRITGLSGWVYAMLSFRRLNTVDARGFVFSHLSSFIVIYDRRSWELGLEKRGGVQASSLIFPTSNLHHNQPGPGNSTIIARKHDVGFESNLRCMMINHSYVCILCEM